LTSQRDAGSSAEGELANAAQCFLDEQHNIEILTLDGFMAD